MKNNRRGTERFFRRLASREGTSFSTFMFRLARACTAALALCLAVGIISGIATRNVTLGISLGLGLALPVLLTFLGGLAMLFWPGAFSAWAVLIYVAKAAFLLACLTLAAPLLLTKIFALGFALGIFIDLAVISLVFLRLSAG